MRMSVIGCGCLEAVHAAAMTSIGHDVDVDEQKVASVRRYLSSGIGFGGGCLPEDIRSFAARAEELGAARPGASCARSTASTCDDVVVTDPATLSNAARTHPQLGYAPERHDALRDADAVVVVSEWDLHRRELSPEHAGPLVAGRVIVDGRNCLDAAAWRAAGWSYHGMGRR